MARCFKGIQSANRKKAKEKGLNVTCSVAIHNLTFNEAKLKDFDTRFKVLPPLRTEKDRMALVKGVKDGVIDLVTSDHCPIDVENKKTDNKYNVGFINEM